MGKRSFFYYVGALVFLLFSRGGLEAAATPHYVFAHYMVCYATYGQNIDGYKREIQEAQAAGIDGFALNVGAWDNVQLYYKQRVELMYQAAEQLGTGFKLFFSVDFEDPTNTVAMVEAYAKRPNTFHYNNKIVLSCYGHNDVPTMGWVGVNWTNILGQLNTDGYPIFFIPYFFSYYVHELPTYDDGVGIMQKYPTILDGLFWYGAAGLPDQLAQCNSNYNAAAHSVGKPFMAAVAPHYWGETQYGIGRRYYEFSGGEGIVSQWQNILAIQPDWVEIVTWNDFGESSYVSPVDDPGVYFGELQTPHRYSHKGYLEISKRYISWYKNGTDPGIHQDSLYYFYRVHATNLVASDVTDTNVGWWYGTAKDSVFAAALLTAPAQLQISTGGKITTNSLTTGLNQVEMPFTPGPQIFKLFRNGRQLMSLQGPDVLAQITNYDYFPASGFVYYTNSISPPGNLKIGTNQ